MSIPIIIAVWIGMAVGFVVGAAWGANAERGKQHDRIVRRMKFDDNGNDYRH